MHQFGLLDLIHGQCLFQQFYFGFSLTVLVEEYVYRWFITEQAALIFEGNPIKSGTISVLSFTLHHVVAVSLVAPIWMALFAGLGGWIWRDSIFLVVPSS